MTRALVLAGSVALTVALSLSLAAQPKIDVRFGILVVADGDARFIETTSVPNIVGQGYGWIATIEPRAEPIPWTEELRLPRAARVWPDAPRDPDFAVNEDRTAAQTRGVLNPGQREFSHFWFVAPDDPSGRYAIVVKVSDGVVANFTFDVVGP